MAENTTLNLGTGGDVIATDDIGGVKHQRVKVQHGADGSATDASAASPLPVQIGDGTDQAGVTAAGALSVDGSAVTQPVSATALPLPAGAATEATTALNSTPSLSVVDSGNSTAVPLGSGAAFTGGGLNVLDCGSVSVICFSDQASAADGLSLEWSSNGTNWDVQDMRTVPAGVSVDLILPRVARFFRVVYTNGGVAQGVFRLETIQNIFGVSGEILPLNAELDGNDTALSARAVIAGDSGGGVFVNVGVTAGGNFKIDLEDIAGVAIDTGSGIIGAGTQRVVLATDQPAVTVDGSGVTQPVSVVALPLPSGASTAALQLPDDHNVTVTSLPLPTGAATSAAQLADNHNVVANPGTADFNTASSHTRNEAFKESTAIGGELDDTTTVAATEGNVSPARITAQRALHANLRNAAGTEVGTVGEPVRIDPTGTTTQPISATALPLPAGAATAAGQLADGHNVTVDNTVGAPANVRISDGVDTALVSAAGALVVDGSGVTQPVSAASLPLPAGAATSAGQLPDGHAVTVDNTAAGAVNATIVDAAGNSAMDEVNDALRVNIVAGSGSGTEFNEDAPAAGGEAGPAVLGVRQDADTSPVSLDGDFHQLIFDAAGNLKVNVKLGGGTGGTSSSFAAAFPGTGTAAGWSDGTNMQGPRVFDADTAGGFEYVPGAVLRVPASGGSIAASFATGARDAGTQRITIATDDTLAVTVASLPLPAGASTSAAQLADNHNVVANAGSGDFLSIAAHVTNEVLKEAMAIGGQFDDAATVVATEDNVAPVRITAQRGLHANLRNVAGTEIGTAAAPVRTDPTGTTPQPVTAASLPLPAGAATSALQLANGHDVTVDNTTGAPANVQVGDGTNQAGVTSTSRLQVDCAGAAAHDVAVSGNPVPIALRANLNEPTAVADADATYAWGDLQGRQVVVLDHPAALVAATHGPDNTNVTASGDTSLVVAPGASLSIYVTNFWISNNNTTKVKAALRDATTTRWSGTLAADGGGVTGKFDPPWKLAANAALQGNLDGAGDVDFNVQFYVSA